MTPIRASEKARYPVNWPAISGWVRFDRALGRCECEGECFSGLHHDYWLSGGGLRCPNYHLEPSRFTGSTVVLTTAHLNHTPEDCDPDNLRAMCQACHLAYDTAHHAATRSARG